MKQTYMGKIQNVICYSYSMAELVTLEATTIQIEIHGNPYAIVWLYQTFSREFIKNDYKKNIQTGTLSNCCRRSERQILSFE